jgi:1,4-alpha-glucan branching enzyme
VRLVFHAPEAHDVAVAGSFNDWSPAAAPLARLDGGIWTITLALRPGQHQYAFVVDGRRWVPDPGAPAVEDGFGRRNSVLAIDPPGTAL